eukprot:6006042-Amphidinium_carterae.1
MQKSTSCDNEAADVSKCMGCGSQIEQRTQFNEGQPSNRIVISEHSLGKRRCSISPRLLGSTAVLVHVMPVVLKQTITECLRCKWDMGAANNEGAVCMLLHMPLDPPCDLNKRTTQPFLRTKKDSLRCNEMKKQAKIPSRNQRAACRREAPKSSARAYGTT